MFQSFVIVGWVISVSLSSLDANFAKAVEGSILAQSRPGATQSRTVIALDAEGLRLVNPSTGSTKALSFGMKESNVISVLTQLRGKPRERGTNQECGAGPLGFATWADGLTIWFEKGRFAGWIVDGRQKGSNRLTTIAGIGTGATRSTLTNAYAVDVFQSTLGIEFTAGSFGGLLSGTQQNARVMTFWSGVTCLFR
ncbi:MAG: hypothetical protein SFW36_23750 [Leptolyngbyaceae cyanobacterium bins.59]|nr:hypothetical protein [Leptolyngbyaceae cyanobacterium bins.59]